MLTNRIDGLSYDEIFKRYDEKINLKEIENTISLLSEVSSVTVIDVPDDVLGAVIIAFVESIHEPEKVRKNILDYCKSTLPKTHWLEEVFVMTKFPKKLNGNLSKIAKAIA